MNELWWNGPPFLVEEKSRWPEDITCTNSDITCTNSDISELDEVKREEKRSEICSTLLVDTKHSEESLANVIDCEKFSKLGKLLHVNLKAENQPQIWEIQAALTLWQKEAQHHIKENCESLGVFKDEHGILHCRRIQNSTLPYSTKFPMLLPKKHRFTDLVILDSHETVKHNCIRETFTEVKTNYWIVKGRQAVKVLLSRRVTCKKLLGKAFDKQPIPLLPKFRVADDWAFLRIGVDFAGPLYVNNIYRKKEMNKCYIALFTCVSSRAIHLELVPNLTAESFIRAFKRSIGRHGFPSIVISDNGKTFRNSKVKSFATSKNVSWKFNVPTASWWGGFFEICVKLVKRSLKKVTGNARLSYEELEKILIEIEGVLNLRPLTYVYDEITEQHVTPSYFLR